MLDLLSNCREHDEDIPPVIVFQGFLHVRQSEHQVGGEEEEGQEQETDQEAGGEPGLGPESLEEGEESSQVSPGVLYEEKVPRTSFSRHGKVLGEVLPLVIKDGGQVHHLSPLLVGVEVRNTKVDLIPVNHPNLRWKVRWR